MRSCARKAIVIGGSIGGLFAAILLQKSGWDVDLFERSNVPLFGRGAGIITHPELRTALAAVGLRPGTDFGVDIEWRKTFARDGSVIGTHRCPQTATSWNRLFSILHVAFPAERYHLNKELVRVRQNADGVEAEFADGSKAGGALLIAADGFRSTVRSQLMPAVQPIYAGYVAWRGLIDEHRLSPATHHDLFAHFTFCLPPNEQILGYPVAGENDDLRPGARRYNVVWYRPADETDELAAMLTDQTGKLHPVSIAPHLVSPRVIASMREAASSLLAPQFRELVDLIEQPFLQPIYDLESPQVAFGRIGLLGDSAFVARPHVGAGVTKAMEDAMTLVDCLKVAPVPEALRTFERKRVDVGRRIIERARHLGSYIHSRRLSQGARSLAELHAKPAAVMAETAVMTFL